MKDIIKFLSQVLTVIIVGLLLAMLRQNNRSWYYAVLIPVIAFLSLMVVSLSLAFFGDELTAGGPVKRLLIKNIFFLLPLFIILFLIIDRAIARVQLELFELRAKIRTKWHHLACSLFLILGFSFLFAVVSERVIFFTVTFVLVYLSWKSINTDYNKMEVLSDEELFLRAMSIDQFRSLYLESGVSKEEFISTLRSIHSNKDNKFFLKSLSRQRAKY
jgi:hypothetical protein